MLARSSFPCYIDLHWHWTKPQFLPAWNPTLTYGLSDQRCKPSHEEHLLPRELYQLRLGCCPPLSHLQLQRVIDPETVSRGLGTHPPVEWYRSSKFSPRHLRDNILLFQDQFLYLHQWLEVQEVSANVIKWDLCICWLAMIFPPSVICVCTWSVTDAAVTGSTAGLVSIAEGAIFGQFSQKTDFVNIVLCSKVSSGTWFPSRGVTTTPI